MSLETMYGINASGKDTIAMKIKEQNPSVFITTESRILMWLLGITNDYAAESQVLRAQYETLENTSQNQIEDVTNTAYKKMLEGFRENKNITFLLSHLVFLLHIDKKPTFLNGKDPAFPEISSGLIHIKSPFEDILARMMYDNKSGVRFRATSNVELLTRHQTLCNKKWEQIISARPPETYITVMNENGDLAAAVRQVENFIKIL